MQNHYSAGSFVALPNYVMLLLILMLGMSVGCKGQEPEKRSSQSSDLPREINTLQQSPKTHHYGSYLLKYSGGNFSCELVKDSSAYIIKEEYPGILIHKRKLNETLNISGNTTLVAYYDTITHKLKTQIDLEKITPYNQNAYQNISIGRLDYESMDMLGPDSNCQRLKLPKPTYYYTSNWVRSVSHNGYLCIGFELIKMAKPNMVVGWEQTLIILDLQGTELMRIKLDHMTTNPIITDDGTLLCFSYSKSAIYPSEPFDPCYAAVDIYDLQKNKLLHHFNGGIEVQCDGGENKEGLVYYRFFNRKTAISEQIIIDSKNRTISSSKFKWDRPLLPAWNEYKAFLKTLPSQTIKF